MRNRRLAWRKLQQFEKRRTAGNCGRNKQCRKIALRFVPNGNYVVDNNTPVYPANGIPNVPAAKPATLPITRPIRFRSKQPQRGLRLRLRLANPRTDTERRFRVEASHHVEISGGPSQIVNEEHRPNDVAGNPNRTTGADEPTQLRIASQLSNRSENQSSAGNSAHIKVRGHRPNHTGCLRIADLIRRQRGVRIRWTRCRVLQTAPIPPQPFQARQSPAIPTGLGSTCGRNRIPRQVVNLGLIHEKKESIQAFGAGLQAGLAP